MKKRVLVSFTVFLCILLLFTACSGGKNSGSPLPGGGPPGGAGEVTGRYIQQDVTPPQLADGEITQIRQLPDGKMLVLGRPEEGEPPKAFTSVDGQTWEAFAPLQANVPSAYDASALLYTVDNTGTWWFVVTGPEGSAFQLLRFPNGLKEEVPLAVFSGGQEATPTEIYCGDDNRILLCSALPGDQMEWTLVDGNTGEAAASFKPNFYPTYTGYRNGKIYGFDPGGTGTLYAFDAVAKKQEAAYPLPEGANPQNFLVADISADASLNYIDQNGIFKMALGGSFLQTAASSRSYAFADANFRLQKLCAARDSSFWVAGLAMPNTKLYRYVYDAAAPSASAERLSIWTMEDNALLKLAVSSFSQQNPEYEVVVQTGRGADDTAQTDEDIIRALNTQILSGDLPDVLILDGLPVESMIEKGLLCDLSGLVNPGGYYENILNCYTKEGKTYAYPALFWAPALVQTSVANGPDIENIKTLDDMRPLLCDPALVTFGGYYYLFNTLFTSFAPSIFPGGSRVEEEALQKFLTLTKEAVDAHGLEKTEYDEQFLPTELAMDGGANGFVLRIDPSLSVVSFTVPQKREYAVSIFYDYITPIISSYDFTSGNTARFAPQPGNLFIPRTVAGVPVGAKQEEAGKAFVKALLECQTLENTRYTPMPGFLVKRGVEHEAGMASYREATADASQAIGFPNPEDFTMEELIESLDTPGSTDIVLQNMVYAQVKPFYEGKASLEETRENILQAATLYFAERQ